MDIFNGKTFAVATLQEFRKYLQELPTVDLPYIRLGYGQCAGKNGKQRCPREIIRPKVTTYYTNKPTFDHCCTCALETVFKGGRLGSQNHEWAVVGVTHAQIIDFKFHLDTCLVYPESGIVIRDCESDANGCCGQILRCHPVYDTFDAACKDCDALTLAKLADLTDELVAAREEVDIEMILGGTSASDSKGSQLQDSGKGMDSGIQSHVSDTPVLSGSVHEENEGKVSFLDMEAEEGSQSYEQSSEADSKDTKSPNSYDGSAITSEAEEAFSGSSITSEAGEDSQSSRAEEQPGQLSKCMKRKRLIIEEDSDE